MHPWPKPFLSPRLIYLLDYSIPWIANRQTELNIFITDLLIILSNLLTTVFPTSVNKTLTLVILLATPTVISDTSLFSHPTLPPVSPTRLPLVTLSPTLLNDYSHLLSPLSWSQPLTLTPLFCSCLTWNPPTKSISSIFKIYPKFNHFSRLLLPAALVHNTSSFTWSIRKAFPPSLLAPFQSEGHY